MNRLSLLTALSAGLAGGLAWRASCEQQQPPRGDPPRTWAEAVAESARFEPRGGSHRPRRGDDVEAWIKRQRDTIARWADVDPRAAERHLALDDLLSRYRECADHGLTLRPYDDEHGDP